MSITNSLVSHSAVLNNKYSAKIQILPDIDNKAKNNTILEIY
jgi:hypothetical protein